jgi:hypothetical protein
MAGKDLVAHRIFLRELGYALSDPSPIHIDANVVFLGTQRERVSFNMRYMAIRYALIRHLIDAGEIAHIETEAAGMKYSKAALEWLRGAAGDITG